MLGPNATIAPRKETFETLRMKRVFAREMLSLTPTKRRTLANPVLAILELR